MAALLSAQGYDVTAVDPSNEGSRSGSLPNPKLRIFHADGYEPLADRFGKLDTVYSLEVIEHVMWLRKFIVTRRDLLLPGAMLILSIPYHGWLKNVAIALFGKFDRHVDPLRDGGHIKFWSPAMLRFLLRETGFGQISFLRVGRTPRL